MSKRVVYRTPQALMKMSLSRQVPPQQRHWHHRQGQHSKALTLLWVHWCLLGRWLCTASLGPLQGLTEAVCTATLLPMDQQPYQQRIEGLRSHLRKVYRQATEAGPEALLPESPYYRQVESPISRITAMLMEMGDWP